MILDQFLLVSGAMPAGGPVTGQSLVGSGSIVSVDSIDVGTLRNLGEGRPITWFVRMVQALAGATALEAQVISATNGALTAGVQVLGSTGAIPVASLAAGAESFLVVSPEGNVIVPGRFTGMRYVLTGTATAGSVLAGVTSQPRGARRIYPAQTFGA